MFEIRCAQTLQLNGLRHAQAAGRCFQPTCSGFCEVAALSRYASGLSLTS